MNTNIAKNINRIKDPIAKLRIAAKNDLKLTVIEIVNDLITKNDFYFMSQSSAGLDTLFYLDHPSAEDRQNKRLSLVLEPNGERRDRLYISFEGLISFCGLTKKDADRIARTVIGKLAEKEPDTKIWKELEWTIDAVRALLPKGDKLANQFEVLRIRTLFLRGEWVILKNQALGTRNEPNSSDPRKEFDPVVDRLIELGWTMKQVRQEFLFQIRSNVNNCVPHAMIYVAGAKCFPAHDMEMKNLLKETYRDHCWKVLVSRGQDNPEYFRDFELLCDVAFHDFHKSHKEDVAWFRSKLVDLLSRGFLSHSFQLLLRVGHNFILSHDLKEAKEYFPSLLPEAFKKAYDDARYGVAAAILNQFWGESCRFTDKALEELSHEAVAADLEEVNVKYEKVEEEYEEDYDDSFLLEGPGKEWQDALADVESKRLAVVEEMKEEYQFHIEDIAQLALDFKQPVRFEDPFTYFPSSKKR